MPVIREQLQHFDCNQEYKNVVFQEVGRTNYYRKARPYRIFTIPGLSKVTMTFGLSGAENVSRVILRLNHCRTTADGVVDICVNGNTVFQNLMAPRDEIEWESFDLDPALFNATSNALTIQLGQTSPGVYWLSDTTILIEHQVDEAEEKIDKEGQDLFVQLKKLVNERSKLLKNLRSIAADLDKLHQTINKVKISGGLVKLAGFGLMLGGLALEIISEGSATPIVAEMEAEGVNLLVGGEAVSVGSDLWEKMKTHSAVKEADKNLEEDKKLGQTMNANRKMLKDQIVARKVIFASKCAALATASDNQLLGARLMMANGVPLKNLSKISSKPILEEAFDILEVVSMEALLKRLLSISIVIGAAFTVADLIKEVSEVCKGSPSEMAVKIRRVADELEKGLEKIQHLREEYLTSLLDNLKESLLSSDLRSVGRLLECLSSFDGVTTRYGSVNMDWLNSWNNFQQHLSAEQRAALANAMNQMYQELTQTLERSPVQNQIDLVIVAHGSIGAPSDQEIVELPGLRSESTIPSRMHFSTDNLSSISFYQPWGVLIDARANYGIIQGTIRPGQTSFRGVGHAASIPNTLTRFNVITSNSQDTIPNVWYNAVHNNDNALQELLQYINEGGAVRPFIWWSLGSMSSFIVDSVAAIAAMLISDGRGYRIDLRIHHGHCLDWPSRDINPPSPLATLQQYYNAVQETFRNPFAMTIN